MSRKILVAFGTRPEVIKLTPVVFSLQAAKQFEVTVLNTGQHRELSEQALDVFQIKTDFDLAVMQENQSLAQLQSRLLSKLEAFFIRDRFDGVVVQGDTMSAFSAALSAFYQRIPVFHVEAGLRTKNLAEPYPEEALRQMIARVASLHFAPTDRARQALIQEGINPNRILVTGNTAVDAVVTIPEKALEQARQHLSSLGLGTQSPRILITVHRRENHGNRLDSILAAVSRIAVMFPTHRIVVPVHPNPQVKSRVENALAAIPNVLLVPPLDYPTLVLMMKTSALILTDSGGIQEEAPTFGTPLLVMRQETERMEGVEAGVASLVGTSAQSIVDAAHRILVSNPNVRKYDNPYGDGHAAERIVKTIQVFLEEGHA